MYGLCVAIAIASYLLTRGTGVFWPVVWAFPVIAVTYTILVWMSRADRIGFHVLAVVILYPAAAVLGALPPPHLQELAKFLYLYLAMFIFGILALGAVAYFAGWLSRLVTDAVSRLRRPSNDA